MKLVSAIAFNLDKAEILLFIKERIDFQLMTVKTSLIFPTIPTFNDHEKVNLLKNLREKEKC